MSSQRDALVLIAICLVVVLLSVAGIVSVVLTDIATNLDGLLMILVCLMMGGIFSLMALLVVKQQGWLKFLERKRAAQPAPSQPEKASAGAGK